MNRAGLVGFALSITLVATPTVVASAAAPPGPAPTHSRFVSGLEPGSVRDLLESLSYPDDPDRQALFDQIVDAMPSSFGDQADDAGSSLVEPTFARAAVDQLVLEAIDPTQHECAPTPVDAWLRQAIAGIDLQTLILLVFSRALNVAAHDAILQQATPEREHYGVDGDWTTPVTHTFRDLGRFWDIDSSGIELTAAHGDVWQHPARVRAALALDFGVPASAVTTLANGLIELVASTPALQGGEHPLFTLNAFAFSAKGDPDPAVQGLPDKIIMGDGILDIQPELGQGTDGVAARAILAHEFGHQVQYTHDLIEVDSVDPEASRHQELMADALGSYFLVHARGGALNQLRATEAITNFANVGDCGFNTPGHHGTPNQRRRAATWGATLAAGARPQGHILPTTAVIEQFEAALSTITAPDRT